MTYFGNMEVCIVPETIRDNWTSSLAFLGKRWVAHSYKNGSISDQDPYVNHNSTFSSVTSSLLPDNPSSLLYCVSLKYLGVSKLKSTCDRIAYNFVYDLEAWPFPFRCFYYTTLTAKAATFSTIVHCALLLFYLLPIHLW